MDKPRKQKEYKPLPPVTGTLTCGLRHRWQVIDANPEVKFSGCPTCGEHVSISQGLERL